MLAFKYRINYLSIIPKKSHVLRYYASLSFVHFMPFLSRIRFIFMYVDCDPVVMHFPGEHTRIIVSGHLFIIRLLLCGEERVGSMKIKIIN